MIKRYVVTEDSDVSAVSLVEEPAIEEMFVAFGKEEKRPSFYTFTKDEGGKDEKHMIVGPALIPDLDIYRYDPDQEFEFFINFPKDVVEKLAHQFVRKGWMDMTEDHMNFQPEVRVVESWVKTSENDKSVDYGFDLPIGTWFVQCYVNSVDTWEKIKKGELNGFSIEAFCNYNEILNKQTKEEMNKTNFINELKEMFSKVLDAKLEAIPEEVKEEVVEDVVEDVVDTVEEVVDEETPESTSEEEVTQEELDALQEIVDALQEEIAVKDEEIAELKKKNANLAKQPSAKPVNNGKGATGNAYQNFRAFAKKSLS